MPVRTHHRA